MAISEKITQEDLVLYEIMKNPVLCTEFINNYDKTEIDEPFQLTFYQEEMLADFNPFVSLTCGRSIGKTVALTSLIIWYLVFKVFNSDIVYTVPNKVHLDPVFSNLIRMFRTNTFLKMFIAKTEGINGSENTVTLLSSAKLMCRIAGTSGKGTNVVGLHTPVVLLDEAGYYPYGTWTELKPRITERGLARDPDLIESAMEVVFEIERETASTCGNPSEADRALLLISKLHEGR